jgi:hypothetical protein
MSQVQLIKYFFNTKVTKAHEGGRIVIRLYNGKVLEDSRSSKKRHETTSHL